MMVNCMDPNLGDRLQTIPRWNLAFELSLKWRNSNLLYLSSEHEGWLRSSLYQLQIGIYAVVAG